MLQKRDQPLLRLRQIRNPSREAIHAQRDTESRSTDPATAGTAGVNILRFPCLGKPGGRRRRFMPASPLGSSRSTKGLNLNVRLVYS